MKALLPSTNSPVPAPCLMTAHPRRAESLRARSAAWRHIRRHPLAALFTVLLLFPCSHAADAESEAARIRRQLAAVQSQVLTEYIGEQKSDVEKGVATLIIGGMYESGKLGPPDMVKAEEYYQEAARLGSPEAHLSLGFIYHHGVDSPSGEIPRDPARAREHLQIAADAGLAMAMTQLGIIYADGMNIDPDQKKALAYFRDAAARGEDEAIRRLEPVMRRAREWEEEKPGRKANFPTTREDLLDRALIEERIDLEFNLEREASRVYVEINKRIAEKMKELNETR